MNRGHTGDWQNNVWDLNPNSLIPQDMLVTTTIYSQDCRIHCDWFEKNIKTTNYPDPQTSTW